MPSAIFEKPQRIRDRGSNNELLELEIFECERIDVLQLHAIRKLNAGERVGDPVAGGGRTTRQKNIYKVRKKVDDSANGRPGFMDRARFLGPTQPSESTGERRDGGNENIKRCSAEVNVAHPQLLDVSKRGEVRRCGFEDVSE